MYIHSLKILFIYFQRGEGREKERERNINCKRYIDWLPLAATQACALTRNWTGNLLVRRPVLNPLSHSNQGKKRASMFKVTNKTPKKVHVCGSWFDHVRRDLGWQVRSDFDFYLKPPCPHQTGKLFNMKILKMYSIVADRARVSSKKYHSKSCSYLKPFNSHVGPLNKALYGSVSGSKPFGAWNPFGTLVKSMGSF